MATAAWTLAFLAAFFAVGEAIIRLPAIQGWLATPSLGSRNLHLSRQWHRLDVLVRSGIELDCIALGSSMVLNGFDPLIFDQAFEEVTGNKLGCFNFGVDALTAEPASALAEILVEEYQPRLLIFGTDPRDYTVSPSAEEVTVFLDMPWLRYRLGDFRFEGWLVEHSFLFRSRSELRSLLLLHYQDALSDSTDSIGNRYGFEPYDIVASVATPPSRDDESFHVQYYFRTLGKFEVRSENRAALAEILEKNSPELGVIVVAMPVPATYFDFFEHPQADYSAYQEVVRTTANTYGVLVIESAPPHLIPDDGWMDYAHVNDKGAAIFSEWLGHEIGAAANDGLVPALAPR